MTERRRSRSLLLILILVAAVLISYAMSNARRAGDVLRAAGIDPGARGESLSVEQFAAIAQPLAVDQPVRLGVGADEARGNPGCGTHRVAECPR